MKEAKNIIVRGFGDFEVEFDRDAVCADVKYKGEHIRGVVHVSVVGYDRDLLEDGVPILKLEIEAEI